MLHSVKGAALVGFERGYGLAFSVLEWLPDGAPKLSAPLIVKVIPESCGLARCFNVCTLHATKLACRRGRTPVQHGKSFRTLPKPQPITPCLGERAAGRNAISCDLV